MSETRGWDRPFFTGRKGKIEVIAHRGGAGEFPGETIYAFERAVSLGADVLEMDVHSTRDGELVLIHNKTVEDTTNGTGLVNDLTFSEIKELDAGYRWTNDAGKTFPFRRDKNEGIDIRVPALKDVLERFGDRRLVIEIKQTKPSIVKTLGQLINKYEMSEKVLVASFYDRALKEFRREFPEIATSASTVELAKFVTLNTIIPDLAKLRAVDAVQVGIRFNGFLLPFVNNRTVRAARMQNLPIQPWTVNRFDDMRRVVDLEVDGIITDYPSCLIELLKHKNNGTEISDEWISDLAARFPACFVTTEI